MKIRAKANGDVIDVSEETARELVGADIYEEVDVLPVVPPAAGSKPGAPTKKKYQRRDMTPEG